MRQLKLVPVMNELQEQSLVGANYDPINPTVPVLLQGTLLERIASLLRRHSVPFLVESNIDPSNVDPRRDDSSSQTLMGRLRRVVRVGNVPTALYRLAMYLYCGTTTDPEPQRAVAAADTLVLLDLATVSVEEVRRVLIQLRRTNRSVGVIPIADAESARFALLKSLLIEEIVIRPSRIAFFLGSAVPAGGPPALVQTKLPFPLEESDLLCFAGHSNAFDMSLGHYTLCGRAIAEAGGARRLPCYHDDYCRPLESCRENDSRILYAGSCSASVVLLMGCNLFVPGRGSHDPSSGLIHAFLRSDCIGLVASLGLQRATVEMSVLWMALLARGYSLGRAWRAVDDFERDRLTPREAEQELGTTIVIGNPSLRVAGIPIARLNEANSPGDTHWGLLASASLPPQMDEHVRVQGDVGWHLGVRTKSEVLLWLKRPSTSAVVVSRGELLEKLQVRVRACRRVLGQLAFWELYVRNWGDALSANDLSRPPLAAWSVSLADIRHLAARVLAGSESRPIGLLDTFDFERAFSGLHRQLIALCRLFFDQVVVLAVRRGLLHFHVWSMSCCHVATRSAVRMCSCLEASQDAWVWRSPDGSVERWVYECLRCGPMGEDDGGEWISVEHPLSFVPGEVAGFTCRIVAPKFEELAVVANVLVEFWRRENLTSDPQELVVPAGTVRSVDLSVQIPIDATPGLHKIGVFMVVNGVLVVHRRTIELVGVPVVLRRGHLSSV